MTPVPAEAVDRQLGYQLVMTQGALLAELPIEQWLEEFAHAESVGAVLDPTLFREYLYSGKGELIQDVLRAALAFKQAIQKARQRVIEEPRLARVYPIREGANG